jgi:hypothetical protein
MTRTIVLTGAPASSALRWDEDALTIPHNVNLRPAVGDSRASESSSDFSAQWRKISTKETPFYADQQDIAPSPSPCLGEAIFVTTAALTQQTDTHSTIPSTGTSFVTASVQTATEVLDDFYDKSLALHEDLTSSQLSEFQSQNIQSSQEITQVALPESMDQTQSTLPIPISCPHVSDVRDIPSAAYLQHIQPQTVTINLIVGIMAVPPARPMIVGRRWGQEREMYLLEMLVGDETKAGFEVTMWLSTDTRPNEALVHPRTLEAQTQGLRPHDVVLLRNVALRAYQGSVHGQSLRRGITKVDLLHRRKLRGSDEAGVCSLKALQEPVGTESMLKKVKRVRQWLIDFVGDGIYENLGESSTIRGLPPDTQ